MTHKSILVILISIILLPQITMSQTLPKQSPSPRPSPSYTKVATRTPTPGACVIPQSVLCNCECPGTSATPTPTATPPRVRTSRSTPYPTSFNQQEAEPAERVEFPINIGGVPAVCSIDLDGNVKCSTEFGSVSTVIGDPGSTTLVCSCSPDSLKNVTVNADLSFSKQVIGAEGQLEKVFSPGDLIIAQCGFKSITGETSSVNFDVSYQNEQALSFHVSGDTLIDRYLIEGDIGDNINLKLLCEDGNVEGSGKCNFTTDNCTLSGSAWFKDPNSGPITGGIGCGIEFSDKGKRCTGSFYLEAEQGSVGQTIYEGGLRVNITR